MSDDNHGATVACEIFKEQMENHDYWGYCQRCKLIAQPHFVAFDAGNYHLSCPMCGETPLTVSVDKGADPPEWFLEQLGIPKVKK